MKTRVFIFLMIFGLALPGLASAQIVGGYVKKKANQAVNRAGTKADEEVTEEMNKKVDKEVEKVFDKIFGEDEEQEAGTGNEPNAGNENTGTSTSKSKSQGSNDAASRAMMKKMGINMEPANVQSSYSYDGNILMTMQSWDSDGNTDGQILYTSYTRKDMKGFAIEFYKKGEGTSHMIFDYLGGNMIIMSDNGNEKSGMVTQIGSYSDSATVVEDNETDSDTDEDVVFTHPNLKKTGKSKNVSGYKCDEYIYEDSLNISSYWITTELPSKLWSEMYAANIFTAGSLGYYGGFTMEMEGRNKETDEKVFMQVQEVNPNQPKSISTEGYQLISFGTTPQQE